MSSINEIARMFGDDIWSVPKSWQWVQLQEICVVASGGTPSTKVTRYFDGEISWITPADMSNHIDVFIDKGARNISEAGLENSGARLLPINTVLFSSRAPIGYVAIASKKLATNQGFKNFIPEMGVNPKYLYYWLKFAKHFADKLASGTTFLEISGKNAGLIPAPVAPTNEQDRIVEKLEELLSDLDNGVAELKAAQTKLTQYRQSLLKSAVEGTLTQQWRETHKPKETGAQLLERILKERRQRWEEQKLQEFKEKGQKPPKDWQKKYPEPVEPDISDLPVLPEGWAWATIDQLALEKRYGSSSKTNDNAKGVPVLRMGNIQDGEIDYSNLKYLPKNHEEFPDLFLKDGDLLFNRTNSAELVGKTAIYKDIGKPCSYASYLISVTFSEMFTPELAAYFINSTFGKAWILTVVNQTAGQANVNGTKLGALAIPLPPVEEQKEIVDKSRQTQEEIKSQLQAVEVSLKQIEAQRKNILKSAFSGELVEQDPSDEPASVLLERIKAERDERAKQVKPKRVKKKTNEAEQLMESLREVLMAEGDWLDAQEAFRRCGVSDGTETGRIEELYEELRRLDKDKVLDKKRVGDFDQIRLKSNP